MNWNGQAPARRVLSDRQHPVHIIPELNEIFLATGRCDMIVTLVQKMPNYNAWCNDWQQTIPTNGEGFRHFRSVERFIGRLSEYQHYQSIFVVSRHGVLSLLIARLIGRPAESM
ncbi:histidine phosphatase family protein [Shigella sonnei]